jgi:hemolysin D
MQLQYLVSQTSEQRAKIAEIDRQQAQKKAERATTNAGIEKLNATIPPLQERVSVRKELFDKGLGSKLVYLTEDQDLIGQQQDLNVQQSRLHEADAAIAALKESRDRAVAEYQRGLYDALAKAEQKAAGATQDVIKAEQRTKLQRLSAPIDGVVQQLAVHTVGGVVTPAQALAVVVPMSSELEVEANLSNHDIGFVHTGQPAAIKVDTFNFTRYGLIHGKVVDVSEDAIPRNRQAPPGGETPASTANAGDMRSQQLDYIARVSLDRTQMQVDDKLVNLGPGMAVTVEIKTGRRKIIGYLLSPLLRYKEEVLRER